MQYNNASVIIAPDLAESIFGLREIYTQDYHCRMTVSSTISKLAKEYSIRDHDLYLQIRPDRFYYRRTDQNRLADQKDLTVLNLNPEATRAVDGLRGRLLNAYGVKYNSREILNILVDYTYMEK